MKRIELLEEAIDDLQDAKAFYDRIEPGVGDYCVDSLLSDIQSLLLYSGTHPRHLKLYRALGSRFPFGIFYLLSADVIQIVAVLDLRRDPAWLRNELRDRNS